MQKKSLLFSLCMIEILLNIIRISFYVADELVPFKIVGIGITQLSFFVSILVCCLVILIVQRIPKIESVFLAFLTFVFLSSSYFNPMRDVYFEMQGWVQFVISLTIIRLSLDHSELQARTLLTWLTLILGFFIWCFLVAFLASWITLEFSNNTDIRAEGILTSAFGLGLLLISFIHLTYDRKSKFVFLVGFSSAVLLVFLSVTRSVMILTTLLSLVFFMFFVFRKASLKSIIVGACVAICFIYFAWFLANTFALGYIEFISYRFSGIQSYDTYRIDEFESELSLFANSPFFGHGYGLRYQHILTGKSAFYGHNFYSSILARVGIFGFIVFLLFGIYIKKLVSIRQNDRKVTFLFMVTFALVMLQLAIANFSYHLTLGFYGAIVGLCSAHSRDNSGKRGKIIDLNMD